MSNHRLTGINKWKKGWFSGLHPMHKLFYVYLCDDCNNAGIWDINWSMVKFQIWLEGPLDPSIFGIDDDGQPRVIQLSPSKWFLRSFVLFQQKINSLDELNPVNNAHKQIIRILQKEGIIDTEGRAVKFEVPSFPVEQTPKPAKVKPAVQKFVPPTVDEVRAYCIERRNKIDAEKFVAHYKANGWKQKGGNPIKDWKAAVITWEGNSFNGGGQVKQVDNTPRKKPDPNCPNCNGDERGVFAPGTSKFFPCSCTILKQTFAGSDKTSLVTHGG